MHDAGRESRMVKKFKPLETARLSRRDLGTYIALCGTCNEPYNGTVKLTEIRLW
jgi:hypothetical protein